MGARKRMTSAVTGGAVGALATVVLALGVSACSVGRSDTECDGGAYEVECHPVYWPTKSTSSATVSPMAAPTPSGPCPTDWSEFYKSVDSKTVDWACPLPSPLTSVTPTPLATP